MPQSKEPLYKRIDLHFVWLGLPVGIVIGAGAWLGVPNMILPMALLAFALVICVAYVWVMLPFTNNGKRYITGIVIFAFLAIAWAFWFVFAVDIKIRILDGMSYSGGGEEVIVAASLTNRGKPTSLTHWRARLITSDGRTFLAEPLSLAGDSVKIEGHGGHVTYYAVPDCDLRIETAKALQTGDTDYGIASFLFRSYPAGSIPKDVKIQIEAIDMLGRTIRSPLFLLSDIDQQDMDVFACKSIEQP